MSAKDIADVKDDIFYACLAPGQLERLREMYKEDCGMFGYECGPGFFADSLRRLQKFLNRRK